MFELDSNAKIQRFGMWHAEKIYGFQCSLQKICDIKKKLFS